MMFDAAAVTTAQATLAADATSAPHGAAPDAGPAVMAGHAADRHLTGETRERADAPSPATHEAAGAAGPLADPHAIAPRTLDGDDRATDPRLAAVDDRTFDAADRNGDAGRQIIFIDTSVADYRQLAADWADKGTVVLIDASRDGLDQVRAALAGQGDIAAIHIVSHGDEGVLWLGTTRIDQASIEGDLSATLGAIGRSLAPGGDILLYGCDFAEGDDGAAALHAFAGATHADVAASTDLTGAARLGGDWTLEAQDGAIRTHALSALDWDHTLDPNAPVPIAVQADSLTVTYNGSTVVTGSTGYGGDGRSPDVGQGAVARWTGAATFQGQSLDLVATVASLTAGDAIRFNRPTSTTNGENPTFLLRDLTANGDAQVQIVWSLVKSGTNTPVSADVEFGILDIDGIGGQPFTRESVAASTAGLSYFSREQNTDIYFQSSLDTVTASGTQNENTDPSKPLSTASEATFDWKNVSSWTLTYTLAKNSVTSQAQFYQDGNFDFHYQAPIYTSIPRLDLDADDSTASGNDAHFTWTGGGPASPIVDSDVRVSNPMDINSVTGGAVTLTNAKPGDELLVGALPSGITATTTTGGDGSITVTLSGTGSETTYDQAFRAITFANTGHAPDATQRVITVSFHNDTLTSAIATSRIDVVPVNAAPVRQGGLANQAALDAGTVSYATAQAFSDPDGDALTYAATGLPAGLTIDPGTGVIAGTLGRSASQANGGVYQVVVTATDPSHAATTQGFTLTVGNPPPVARDDVASTNENVPVTIAVLANDSDPDGDPLTVTAASAGHGSVTRNADGTLTYTPDTYFHGTDTIAYAISDGQGGTSSATVAVTVAHVNQAPVANGSTPTTYAAQDSQAIDVSIAPVFSDPDGDALTYGASGLPAGLTLDPATGRITGTLDHSASQPNGGRYPITLTATDPSGASASRSVTLTVTNLPPVAVDDPLVTLHPGDTRTIAVLANDSDPDGDPLTLVAASAAHGVVTINPDGTLRYTADAGYTGSDTIAYTISDGDGGSASAHVPLTIGDNPPTADALPDQTAADAQAISLPVASAFHDADGDALTYSATGLPAGLTIDQATGVIAGTIDRSASRPNGGVYASQVTADDGHGGTVTAPLRWTVTNPPPVARDDVAITAEDTPVVIGVLGNDSDPDGNPLTITAASASHGSVAINPDGTLTYTPATDYNGSDTIRYVISDGQGGTSSAAVAVTVTPVNDAPRPVGVLPAQSARDGGSAAIATAGGFTDIDGDPLTYAAAGLPAGLSIDPATGIIGGTLAPDASLHGPYAVTVTASDPSGASTTQAFSLAVVHPDPVAAPDAATTAQEVPVTIAVLANDASPSGAPLAVTGAAAAHGTVSVGPEGTLTYTPAYGFRGSDTIHYTIGDAEGGRGGADVAVTVTPVEHAPTPTAPLPMAQGSDGEAVRLDIGGYFADRDGDPLRFAATGLPAGLSIDPATGVVGGTLAHDASRGGPYHVTVTATDPSGASAASSFDWAIVHPAPIARDDAAATAAGVPVAVAVLANDTDPAGDPLVVTAAAAAHGSVTIGTDGVLRYTPAAGFAGQDIVTYMVADPDGGTASASVLVSVTPPPVATDSVATTTPDTAMMLPVLTLASDPAGLPLAVTAVTADHGTAAIGADGTVRYVPGAGFTGFDTVRYTVTDSHGGTATALVAVTVAYPDRPPVVPDRAPVEAVGGRPLRLDLLAGASDPDGDPLTVVGASAAVGTLTVAPDGTATYTPPLGFAGTTTLTYTVSDGRGGLTGATLVVRVADGRGADINELLRIGHPRFVDPTPSLARVAIGAGGEVRTPLTLIETVEAIRPLHPTTIGAHPVLDAVEAARDLHAVTIDPDRPIAGEVARLDRLTDRRDAAGRLIDPRWGDFLVKGLTGFSAASDARAGIMIDSVVRGDALYLEVRDTAAGRMPPVRSVDVRLVRGGRPDWLRVDARGLVIVERPADRDELHLVVSVTRTDGRTTTTRVTVQGATGEIELDRAASRHPQPLDATLAHPDAALAAEADRLARSFQ